MNSQSEFAKLIHNLRNQLNNISLNAELAKMELTAESIPPTCSSNLTPALECVDTIIEACSKCAELADALTVAPVASETAPEQDDRHGR